MECPKETMNYFEKKISSEELFHMTLHGHYFVNGYKGCTEGCPFCYWEAMPGWHGNMEIRINSPELLDAELRDWPVGRNLYMGSYCNPYDPIELKYRLTRSLLEVACSHQVPVILSTSTALVVEDAGLIAKCAPGSVVVLELCRIPRLEKMALGEAHEGIEAANFLKSKGLEVWATLAPFLPGITDVELILSQLDSQIPLYVDRLDAPSGSLNAELVLQDIKMSYPQMYSEYEKMISANDDSQYREMLDSFADNPQVRTMPFPLP